MKTMTEYFPERSVCEAKEQQLKWCIQIWWCQEEF